MPGIKRILVFMIVLLTIPLSAWAGDEEAAVRKTVDKLFSALKTKDIAAMKQVLLSRGVAYQYSEKEGWVERVNPELIKWVELTEKGKYLTYTYSDLAVDFPVKKKNMAVASGMMSATWPGDGKMTGRFVLVLIRKDANWYVQVFNSGDIVYTAGTGDGQKAKMDNQVQPAGDSGSEEANNRDPEKR